MLCRLFVFASIGALVAALLAVCGWSGSDTLECDDPPCTKEIVVQDVQLIAVESEMVEAVAVVETTEGLRVTMIDQCAFGSFAGSKIRFAYSFDRPEWVSVLLVEERLPSVVVPKKIIEARIETEFTREGGGAFRRDVVCFD